MEMTLTKGLPASGKSTWSKQEVKASKGRIVRVSRDDLRQMLFNDICLDKREGFVSQIEKSMVLTAIAEKKDIIIDSTHLQDKYMSAWKTLAEKNGYKFKIQDFTDVSVEECIRRDKLRPVGRVGAAVINGMALNAGMLDFSGFNEWAVFDMDGTLADISWRGPFEYEKVLQDKPREEVAARCAALYDKGVGIFILSGRATDVAGASTEDWLELNRIPYHHIFMRRAKDYRKDTIIKKEIMDKLPSNKVKVIVDDRPCVLRLWQEMFDNSDVEIVDVGNGIEF